MKLIESGNEERQTECQCMTCTKAPRDELGLFCRRHRKLIPEAMYQGLVRRAAGVNRHEFNELMRRICGMLISEQEGLPKCSPRH